MPTEPNSKERARPWMPDCGEERAYWRHRSYGEPPCWKCCAGHAAEERKRYQADPKAAAARKQDYLARKRQEVSA